MKKSNVIIAIIIGILLITISVSFAYFVATTNNEGTGGTAVVTTTTIEDTIFNVEGTLEFSETNIYPGHSEIMGIKVTATGGTQEIRYNVIWTSTNSIYSTFNYTVYKTTDEIEASTSCEVKEDAAVGITKYYEECTINNENALGEAISSGVITSNNEDRKIILVEDESIKSTSQGVTTYYYVLLEYPNLDIPQDRDQTKVLNGVLSVEQYTGEQICGTHNVTTALGVLAVNDCEPNFQYTSEEADLYGELCLYNGKPVYDTLASLTGGNTLASKENCGTTYQVLPYDTYMDSQIEMVIQQAYVGEATWNESASSCTFNNQQVVYFNGTSITTKEHCGSVYTTDGSTFVSGIVKVGNANWGKMPGTTGIYETQDEEGTSYYYRGNVENNYVKFANKYWRIIRINGNGSLRLIYSGEVATVDAAGKETVLKNGYDDSSTDYTQIGTSAFNTDYNDNAYVGFKYTLGEVHGTSIKSTILENVLEPWYENNLTSYVAYLDIDSGFCNDRSLYSGTGIGTTPTYYSAYNRTDNLEKPTLKCADIDDYFTIKTSNKGNKALEYPIGLITADEAMFAGGTSISNSSYYLYTGNWYWTMSPNDFSGLYADEFCVNKFGYLSDDGVHDSSSGVRPVISLSTDQLTISGRGTIDSPYVFS